jgi:hypothetical protein
MGAELNIPADDPAIATSDGNPERALLRDHIGGSVWKGLQQSRGDWLTEHAA